MRQRGRRRWIASVAVVATVLPAGLSLAPPAAADPGSALSDAVTAARSGAPCGPLQYNPVVAQATAIINESTDDYLDQTATQVPILDAVPGLEILGHPVGKAKLLQGADKRGEVAIKGLLLQGFEALTDCSYTEFGVDMRHNPTTGYVLAAVVLTAP